MRLASGPAAAVCMLVLAGCGVTGYSRAEAVGLDQGRRATREALMGLGYTIGADTASGDHATVTAEAPGKPDARVRLDVRSEHITEFHINVGMVPDDESAEKIMDAIKAHF